jgi:hypothetical protein
MTPIACFSTSYLVLILFSLVIQGYVAALVFKEEGPNRIIKGIFRGTSTFFEGWRQANDLGIKHIMIFWTILLVIIILPLCVVGTVGVITGELWTESP